MAFQFKQFFVEDAQCAMKVGTDGVLLAAWTNVIGQKILDVGAGSGVVALILAQKVPNAQIDAIEIDEQAYQQMKFNFQQSPFIKQLHPILDDFKSYKTIIQYDTIVSNPPFFTSGNTSKNEARAKARHQNHLLIEDLLYKTSQLLKPTGIFSLIIPYQSHQEVIKKAAQTQLFPQTITHVKGTLQSPFKRSLITFSFITKKYTENELIIEESRHQYTPEYIDLVKNYYLKM